MADQKYAVYDVFSPALCSRSLVVVLPSFKIFRPAIFQAIEKTDTKGTSTMQLSCRQKRLAFIDVIGDGHEPICLWSQSTLLKGSRHMPEDDDGLVSKFLRCFSHLSIVQGWVLSTNETWDFLLVLAVRMGRVGAAIFGANRAHITAVLNCLIRIHFSFKSMIQASTSRSCLEIFHLRTSIYQFTAHLYGLHTD